MAYLVSVIGSDGGANSGKSVAGLSSTALNSSAGRSPAPGMNGNSELTWPTSLNAARALRAGAQNVQRGVGVAAQAVARVAIDHAFGHQLRDDIEPARQQIGRGMGIVCGDVMLLRERHMQPFSRQEEKLDHLDIGRQRTGMQRIGIGQIGIAAEQAVDHRAQ